MPDKEEKNQNEEQFKIIIIGAGISGITAAIELIKLGYRPEDILILEANDYIGGKLCTYIDGKSNLVTEYGAGIFAPNYAIITSMAQFGIEQEKLLPVEANSNSTKKNADQLPFGKWLRFGAKLIWEHCGIAKHVWNINWAKNKPNQALPVEYEQNFKTFADQHHLGISKGFIEQCLWTGFGYGAIDDKSAYAHRVLEYMGYTTLPLMTLSSIFRPFNLGYRAVRGGYQRIVEEMAKGFTVRTSVTVENIDRTNDDVQVRYLEDGCIKHCRAKYLILATSPYHWPGMNLKLTPAEQACVNHLTYYPYLVAVCRIKGFPAQHVYDENPRPGHVAFLTTRDNRKDPKEGTLFSAYVNGEQRNMRTQYPPLDKEAFKASIIQDLKDLAKQKGFEEPTVEVLDMRMWIYNPTVPWDKGKALQEEERIKKQNTLHLNAFLPGNSEVVSSAIDYAEFAVRKWEGKSLSCTQRLINRLNQIYLFFSVPTKPPIDDTTYREGTECIFH